MPNTRDELLVDPLLPLVNEEPKPALTLSELFNTERVILGAIKDQLVNATTPPPTDVVDNPYEDRKVAGNMSSAVVAPEFDFDDPNKNQLARNAWEQMECRMAGGGYHHDKEATFKNIGFMLNLNMSIYDNLPHKNFIGVQPMDHPHQLTYHQEFTPANCGEEKAYTTEINNSVKTYAVEAKTKRLSTCINNFEDDIQLQHSPFADELEKEILEMTARLISGELYSEMISKIESNASVSTVVTEDAANPPTALDILSAIQDASDEIARHSALPKRSNWIIMSPPMASILLSDKNALDRSVSKEAPHISMIGSVCGMDVYMDTEGAIKSNNILVGRKGDHTISQGITFCPHTLAMDSGNVVHPTTFNNVKTFMNRGDWFEPEDSNQYFHKIEFKEAPITEVKQQTQEMDTGYFYCPYIPLMTTKAVPEEDLMDIVLPFGAPERKTIAELFS